MNKILFATILLSAALVAQQPCPTGYHHEGDTAACWPDVSRQESHTGAPTPLQPAQVEPAPTQVQPPPLAPISAVPMPTQSASLVIFREGHFTGSALKPSIYVDGKEVARIKNGTYFSTQIEPGKHNLTSSAKHESPLLIEVKPGETSYIQMIVVTGTWRGAGRLVPVPLDDGKAAVAKLHILD